LKEITEKIASYWISLDKSLDALSHKEEGRLPGLPHWAMAPRRITIGVNIERKLAAIRVRPDDSLEADEFEIVAIKSDDDFRAITDPWTPNYTLSTFRGQPFFMAGGLQVVPKDRPLEPAGFEDPGIVGIGNLEHAVSSLTAEKGKEDAINLWNMTIVGIPPPGSFVLQAQNVFRTFAAIVKRKSFLERRIHRFLYQHAKLLLPSYNRCFFEHLLSFGHEHRIADFILERDPAFPALLIELESPSAKLFRKNGEPTAEANHACNQIAEWVMFIEKNPTENASGDFEFLTGSKERLVVMGRGLEDKQLMLYSRFRDAALWSYDLLLLQAKNNWSSIINEQRRLLGLAVIEPF